jgi:hypothetical protein
MDSLTNLAKKQKDLQEQVRAMAQENVAPALRQALVDLKAAVPQLVGVRWFQYTPYFNDGDECVFGLHGAEFSVGGDYEYLSTWKDYFDKATGLDKNGLTTKQVETLLDFESNLGSIEEMLKIAFGDHAQVTLTSDGIETEEYEHD